ncbi:MAG: DUF2807 domain-containing protein [Caulobacteraceae bacterium]|nr:DUF2807 domain-containing protein [Caulobacteraceae bacterium]
MRLILAASALVLATAGVANAETRNLTGFTKVEANAGTDVEVTVGAAFSVEVTGRDANRIVTRVQGDTLVVEPTRDWSWRGRQANVRVTLPRVNGLSASSGRRPRCHRPKRWCSRSGFFVRRRSPCHRHLRQFHRASLQRLRHRCAQSPLRNG